MTEQLEKKIYMESDDNQKQSAEAIEANNMLRQYVHRIEKLEREKEELLEGMGDIYNEAKNEGFDAKILKKIVNLRKLDKRKRLEEEMLLDHYKAILGME